MRVFLIIQMLKSCRVGSAQELVIAAIATVLLTTCPSLMYVLVSPRYRDTILS